MPDLGATELPTSYPLGKHEVLAVEQYVRMVTVPIFSDEGARKFAGTGTLFTIAGRQFVVTAAHILQGIPNPAMLACPENPTRGEIYSLGKITVSRPQKAEIDVAVIELLDPDSIARMHSGWRFLNLSSVRAPFDRGVFVLSGFPIALGTSANGKVTAPMSTIYSERMEKVPIGAEPPVDPTLDLFFHYDPEGMSWDNQPFPSPDLYGTSGGSVWQCIFVLKKLWSPEAAVKVVGVQSAFLRGRYFRAKNWGAVAEVLKRIDVELSKAVEAELRN